MAKATITDDQGHVLAEISGPREDLAVDLGSEISEYATSENELHILIRD